MIEGSSDVMGWTPDSDGIVLVNIRNGAMKIYRQSLEKDIAEPIVTSEVAWLEPQARSSPDRASVFYWVPAKQTPVSGTPTAVLNLMRIPIGGGPSRLVLSSSRSAWADVRCAKSPATLCVLLEMEGDRGVATLTAFDPVKGREQELFKLDLGNWYEGWDVSPDGGNIAFVRNDAKISMFSLHGRLLEQIAPKGWTWNYGFDWAADGKGWFTSGRMGARQGLLHVDLQGNARLLWPVANLYINFAVPSPDGHRLAISATAYTYSNVWMIENF